MRRFFDVRFFVGFGAGVACTLLVLAVGVLFVMSRLRAAQELQPPVLPPAATAPVLGAAGEGLRLRTLDGAPVPLSDFEGRVVVVNLWATWCAPCLEEMPTLQALHDDLPRGVALAVVSDEPAETVRAFVEAQGYTFPVYRYEPPRGAPFDSDAIPATYVVAPDGSVVLAHVGAADWNAPSVRAFLRRLAEG